MKKDITRRDFIKGSMAASVAIAGGGLLSSCSQYKPKGLATAILGKTGVEIPRIALGLGSRWCAVGDEEKALEILTYALDKGLYYWDTAAIYENKENGAVSEERIGKILKDRRKEVFISTKIMDRDPEVIMQHIERSLKRLQIDQLDMLKVHSVQGGDKLEELKGEGKAIEIVHRMKEEGLTKYIGFSGHSEAAALKYMAENYEFDSMLFALNHYNANNNEKRQEMAIPAANAKGMGVMLMKVIRPIENDNSLDPTDMIRYALSIDGVSGTVLGTDSKEVVDANVALLKDFKSMSKDEMDKLTARLTPFFNHQGTPWMEPGYCDGNWA
jgi:predicted aldo/keto reductase-like oxidoreductase